MFDGSLAFRKIAANKYHFVPGSVFSKKGYIVNTKEKNELMSLTSFAFRNMTLSLIPMILTARRHLILGIGLMAVIGVANFWLLRKKVRHLISSKEPVQVKPLGLVNTMKKQILQMDNSIKRHMFFSFIFFSGVLVYSVINFSKDDYLMNCLILLICAFFGIFLGCICFFIIKLWFKKDLNVRN